MQKRVLGKALEVSAGGGKIKIKAEIFDKHELAVFKDDVTL